LREKRERIVIAGQTYSLAFDRHDTVFRTEPYEIARVSISDPGTACIRQFRLNKLDRYRNAGDTAQLSQILSVEGGFDSTVDT
jgi:hypothetical protein